MFSPLNFTYHSILFFARYNNGSFGAFNIKKSGRDWHCLNFAIFKTEGDFLSWVERYNHRRMTALNNKISDGRIHLEPDNRNYLMTGGTNNLQVHKALAFSFQFFSLFKSLFKRADHIKSRFRKSVSLTL